MRPVALTAVAAAAGAAADTGWADAGCATAGGAAAGGGASDAEGGCAQPTLFLPHRSRTNGETGSRRSLLNKLLNSEGSDAEAAVVAGTTPMRPGAVAAVTV